MNDIESQDESEEYTHESGLSYIRIELYDDGKVPADTPAESVTIPVRSGKRYAVDDGVGTFEEHLNEFLEYHVSGACECLKDNE